VSKQEMRIVKVKQDRINHVGSMQEMNQDIMNTDVQEAVNQKLDEEKDIEARKNNIIIYRVPESKSDSVKTMKETDYDFIVHLCQNIFGFDIKEGDIIKQFRLGAILDMIHIVNHNREALWCSG